MDLIEISEKRTMKREEAAKLLHQLADSLARHNSLDFDHGDTRINVRVPDTVSVEVELEVESDESSLEIEISW